MDCPKVVHPGTGVSVIVPTFERAGYLPECLDSILGQLRSSDQLIVVDDGSTDETPNVLDRYSDRVTVISTANQGKAAAVNTGLGKADRPFVWIVDDDDVASQDCLSSLLNLFDEKPSADIAYGRYLRFFDDPSTGKRSYLNAGHWVDTDSDNFFIATLEDMFVHQPGMIVRRSLYDRVGPFDEDLNRSIDYEMLIRLALSGRAVATQAIVFHQRLHCGDRGAARNRIAAADRNSAWLACDSYMFRTLHADMPLSAYLPDRRITDRLDRRRAALQRAVIMTRKRLWELAIQDFALALDQDGSSLTRAEREIARRAFGSKYGCEELLRTPEFSREVAKLARKSEAGRDLARALANGLVWRVRESAEQFQIKRSFGYAAKGIQWLSAAA